MFLGFAAVGAVVFGVAVMKDPTRAWSSFVHNHFYFMSLAVGGLFFAAIQWLTGAMWSAPVRRLAESYTGYLPLAIASFGILYFGADSIYEWTDHDKVAADLVLSHKAGYLNKSFFWIRNLVALGVWWFFAKKMIGNSVAQDASGDVNLTLRNRALAPAFLILFALTFTMASYDQMMSLDAHWFSTIFGVYCFAGLFYSTLALTTLFAVFFRRQGALKGIVTDDHLHDLGKFLFAFTIFWAYIAFSQFLLIWYANLPEETMYFLTRLENGWIYVSIFLLCGKFLVPFLLLMPRDAKRSESRLIFVASFMLVAQWIDVLWLVQPEFLKSGPRVGWIEIGVMLGFVGFFGTMVMRFMSTKSVLAARDPKLPESVFHHHQ
jgi:hypothetical protein